MTWEQRWHPLREEWVIVAAHRNNRPWVGGDGGRPGPQDAGIRGGLSPLPGQHPGQRGEESRLHRGLRLRQRHALRRAQGAAGAAAARAGIYRNRPAEGLPASSATRRGTT